MDVGNPPLLKLLLPTFMINPNSLIRLLSIGVQECKIIYRDNRLEVKILLQLIHTM